MERTYKMATKRRQLEHKEHPWKLWCVYRYTENTQVHGRDSKYIQGPDIHFSACVLVSSVWNIQKYIHGPDIEAHPCGGKNHGYTYRMDTKKEKGRYRGQTLTTKNTQPPPRRCQTRAHQPRAATYGEYRYTDNT